MYILFILLPNDNIAASKNKSKHKNKPYTPQFSNTLTTTFNSSAVIFRKESSDAVLFLRNNVSFLKKMKIKSSNCDSTVCFANFCLKKLLVAASRAHNRLLRGIKKHYSEWNVIFFIWKFNTNYDCVYFSSRTHSSRFQVRLIFVIVICKNSCCVAGGNQYVQLLFLHGSRRLYLTTVQQFRSGVISSNNFVGVKLAEKIKCCPSVDFLCVDVCSFVYNQISNFNQVVVAVISAQKTKCSPSLKFCAETSTPLSI